MTGLPSALYREYDAMQDAPERILARQLVHFYKAAPDYGRGVARKLGLDMEKLHPLGETFAERVDRENRRISAAGFE